MDRNLDGTFGIGNGGGPGRPRRTAEEKYLATLSDTVTIEEWVEIVTKAISQAKAGDAKARDWLSKHLLGSDPQAVLDLVDQIEQLRALIHNRSMSNGKEDHRAQQAAG